MDTFCENCGQGELLPHGRGRRPRPRCCWTPPRKPARPPGRRYQMYGRMMLPDVFDCPWCGETVLIPAHGGGQRGRCQKIDCRRAFNARRMRELASRKRSEGVDVYAPYREAAKMRRAERVAAGLELPARQRYPEAAALKDARRRALIQEYEAFNPHDVFVRDAWVCQLCLRPVDPELPHPDPMSRSLDHTIPLSKGGAHTAENAQLAHLVCNLKKGARLG